MSAKSLAVAQSNMNSATQWCLIFLEDDESAMITDRYSCPSIREYTYDTETQCRPGKTMSQRLFNLLRGVPISDSRPTWWPHWWRSTVPPPHSPPWSPPSALRSQREYTQRGGVGWGSFLLVQSRIGSTAYAFWSQICCSPPTGDHGTTKEIKTAHDYQFYAHVAPCIDRIRTGIGIYLYEQQ